MPRVTEEQLLQLLRACAVRAPEPLYPARFAADEKLDRDTLDVAMEELRRRGLLRLTDWVKDLGQGYALTDQGNLAAESGRVPTERAAASIDDGPRGMTHYERGEIVRRAIFDPQPARVAWILLAANLIYFAFGAVYVSTIPEMSVSDYLGGRSRTTVRALIDLGALPLVFTDEFDRLRPRPQFERIILHLFMHIGLLHLGMNMYFLGSIGRQIEAMWGWPRFLAIYLIAGIVAGCVVLLSDHLQERASLTAGASGSLYGMFMALVVFFYLNRDHMPEGLIQDWSRSLATNAFLLFAINFLPSISWQGHLGGAIGGLLAALLLHVQRFHPSPGMRWLAMAALPIVPGGFFLAVLWQVGYF